MSAEPAASHSPIEGRTLGDFVVREKIGQGGFGAVYRAEQTLLAREAVVKVLHTRHRAVGPVVQRFLREAKLASRLDHPYAAHIYSFGAEPDGLLWIAMELVRGIPLDELIRLRGPVPLPRLVPLFEHICEVVQTAHDLGIVHRDLKPANVMVLTRAGRLLPKLLDLGIAKAADDASVVSTQSDEDSVISPTEAHTQPTEELADTLQPGPTGPALTQDGALLGSPSYMAPEQWTQSNDVGAPADIYALGAVAYEALTGKVLFDGKTLHAIAKQHAQGAVPPLGEGFPRALDAVLARALAKRAADRYGSAVDFARALRAASGIGESSANLPRMAEPIRDQVLADAPQPIAESVALLDAAQNEHQTLDAIWQTFGAITRYLGLVAIAAASRAEALPAEAAEMLQIMRRRSLNEEEWLDLARELCRPFARRRDAHPVPELVEFFFSSDGTARTDERVAALHALQSASRTDLHERIGFALTALQGLLGTLGFLGDYHVGVPRGGKLERWMGVRRPQRTGVPQQSADLVDQQPILMSSDGAPILRLWPLFQVAAPSPGAPDELFLFDGQTRHGPRLVAPPHGFERRDPELWDHLQLSLADADPAEQRQKEERAPYRGLAGFSSEDAGMFFGRERESEAVVNRLRVQSLIAIVGPSGAGKSSFVQAGVVPLLPAGWRTISVRPGHSPIATLAARLERDGAAPGLEESLATDPGALYARLEHLAGDGVIVLILDQFEELFTLCSDEVMRARFCEALVLAARSAEARVRIVLTLRDDFLLRAEAEPALRDRLSQGLQLLTTPAAAELLRILIEPARAVGYDFEDRALAQEMVEAVVGQPGALPLLSFTAMKLWEQRDRHFKQLRRRAYESLGKVGGALANHAEEIFAQMSPEEQRLVREVFRHLVTSEGTRAVLSRAELVQILGPRGHGESVVERLIGARLLQASEAEGRVEQIEIVHEALLGAWPRLADWRHEDAEGARIRDQLRTAARQWDQRGRPRGMLWRQEALAELELWRRRHGQGMTVTDEAFASASVADSARGRRILRATIAVIIVLLAGGVWKLVRANTRAVASAAVAEDRLAELYEETGRTALIEGQPQKALVFLSEAYSRGRGGAAMQFMLARGFDALAPLIHQLVGHEKVIVGGDLRMARGVAITASLDGTARVWDLATGRGMKVLDAGSPLVIARFLGAGTEAITTTASGQVRVWDVESGNTLRAFSLGASGVQGAVVSEDGRTLVIWRAREIEIWDIARGTLRQTLPGLGSTQFIPRLSADAGRLLYAGVDNSAHLWDLRAQRIVATVRSSGDTLMQSALSPDGGLLAVADQKGSVQIMDLASGKIVRSFTAHLGAAIGVEFSHDGKRLVSSGQDRTARVWDAKSGEMLFQLNGHTGAVLDSHFASDDRSLLTVSEDGTARLWDTDIGRSLLVLHDQGGLLKLRAFDGQRVLTSNDGRSAKLWDTTRSPLLASMRHQRGVLDAGFIEEGRRIATVTSDGVLHLWDRTSGLQLREIVSGAADSTLLWIDVPAGGQAAARVSFVPGARGLHHTPAISAETRFPLGLFRTWAVWRPATQLLVYPQPERPAAALPAARAVAGGTGPSRNADGGEVEGVRAYRHGDPLKMVAWKKAAKTLESSGELVSRDTSASARQALWLDWQACASLAPEQRLSRLAAWALLAHRAGAEFGLRLPGLDLPPAEGEAQRRRCLEALALWQ